MSLRALSAFVVVASACGAPPRKLIADSSGDLPVAGLEEPWSRAFTIGDRLFDTPFRPADGLGPLYIRTSCGGCHEGAGRGPGAVERVVQLEADGTATPGQPALPYGPVERPFSTSGASPLLAPMRSDVHRTQRSGTPVMGRGWLEAISDGELLRLEEEQAREGRVSGRVNWITIVSQPNTDTRFHQHQPGQRVIGRFGLKARVATLDDFAADALQGDMGITSPLRPTEVANAEQVLDDAKPGVDVDFDAVNALGDYVRLIAIPRRETPSPEGVRLFAATGCASCHTPSLRTRDDYPIPQLAGRDAEVFCDLLLHDLGDALADGLTDESAGPREWRTAPLIGLRFLTSFLHDGRAPDVETAITLHAGEAQFSLDAFNALTPADRAALVHYVSSL